MKPLQILVPRWVDAQNRNPQNLNAAAMLARFRRPDAKWRAFYYHSPVDAVRQSEVVELVTLWQTRLWKADVVRHYQQNVDAIFYPGVEREDELGWSLRKLSGRRVPLIATMESLVGDASSEVLYSEIAGHPVHCARVGERTRRWIDQLFKDADLVIAISPFLAKLGTELYGQKFRVQMLGVDGEFSPTGTPKVNTRLRVINVASFQARKRPELFFELARRFPQADFIWYGDGRLGELRERAQTRGLKNLSFPGGAQHSELPEIMRSADLFVLPSNSEGVPKVTQEAAACGLPVIVFGFYEAPSVIHDKNGFVVWDDEELFHRIDTLLESAELRKSMGECGAMMAGEWSWDKLAPKWETEILSFLGR
jgi:glycosyltransferase involved in cell wall biosynthesis